MNVQTLITQMLIGMGEGHHNGKPLKTMKDLYLCFENDVTAIARHTGTNTGIVFAELVDAVEETKVSLRDAMERAQAKLAEADAAREVDRLRAVQDRIEAEVARPAAQQKATEAPRRTRRAATATTAPASRKKPGVSRKPVAVMAEPKRRGRPPKNR